MKKRVLTLLMLVASVYMVTAQQVKVAGRVNSAATGTAAEGISVTVKGTKRGTVTGPNGSFSLTANKGETLVISGVGFSTQEVVVNSENIDINLNNLAGDLGEVVVVGYGTQKKASITGAVNQLSNAALTKRQVSSTTQVLQGLAPGVTVQQQSGRPGADGAGISIRGISSLGASNTPLVVIDGVQMPTNTGLDALNQIDPNAIESISVLKDAASTAIYGNRSSNGVIVVKTKRAAKKGLQVSYNSFISKQEFTSIPDRVSAIDHMELTNLAERNRTGNPASVVFPQSLIDKYKTTPANNLDVIDTDWLAEVLTNSGIMHNHNVQIMSGGERVNLFTSFTFLDQQGLIQNNSFRKYDLRFNPEFKLHEKVTLSGVIGFNNGRTVNPSTSSPEFIIRQAIGLPAIGGGKFGPGMYGDAAQSNNRNPIAQAESAGTSVAEANTLFTRVGLTYRPIKGLELEGAWARERRNPYTKTFTKNVDIYRPNLTTQGYDKFTVWPGTTSLSEAWRNDVTQNLLGQATYNFRIKQDHSFKVMAGAQRELFTNYFFGASRTGFVNPNQPYLNLGTGQRDNNSGVSELALVGLFGRVNYNFREKYFLELNGRRDASSRFSQARDNQWGTFGSASAAWIFTKEAFMDNTRNVLTFGKIRGSFGGNGNQNIGGNYVFDSFYGQSVYSNNVNGTNAYFNNTTTVGQAVLQFSNPDLGWETAKQWNIGVDLTFWNKLTITADVFEKTSKDMILTRTLPASAGGLGNPSVNAGNMTNKGWEFMANYKTRVGKWSFDITGMLSDVRNEVTGLVEGLPFIDGGSTRTQAGQAIGSYFGWQSLGYFKDSNDVKTSPVQFGAPWNVNPATGTKPGDVKYADISGPDGKPDGIVNELDRTFLGNAFPRYEYSLNINIGYGNFDLNIFGQGVGKRNNFYSGTGAIPFNSGDFAASLLEQHKDTWSPTNQGARFPRLLPSGFGGNNYRVSDHWIKSASYFRLKNLVIGYTLPTVVLQKIHITSMRFFVGGQNLFTATKAWDGFDPEINNANAEFYPVMRTYTAGLNVNF